MPWLLLYGLGIYLALQIAYRWGRSQGRRRVRDADAYMLGYSDGVAAGYNAALEQFGAESQRDVARRGLQ